MFCLHRIMHAQSQCWDGILPSPACRISTGLRSGSSGMSDTRQSVPAMHALVAYVFVGTSRV
jgi:hypothetical protein